MKIRAKISPHAENTRQTTVFFYALRPCQSATFEKSTPSISAVCFSGFRKRKSSTNLVDFLTFAALKPPPMRWYKRLQQKWNVNPIQLALILVTFAVGGSLTGQVGKYAMDALNVEGAWYWGFLYLLIVTALWPIMVLLVSLPMGQFRFFLNYIGKLAQKMGLRKKT